MYLKDGNLKTVIDCNVRCPSVYHVLLSGQKHPFLKTTSKGRKTYFYLGSALVTVRVFHFFIKVKKKHLHLDSIEFFVISEMILGPFSSINFRVVICFVQIAASFI